MNFLNNDNVNGVALICMSTIIIVSIIMLLSNFVEKCVMGVKILFFIMVWGVKS